MSTKSLNPFQSNGWNYLDKLGESSSYMPHFYEDDMTEPMTPSFRSLSPKIYNQQQKHDYFTEIADELIDDGDDLYEATLMNSNFLQSLDTKPATTVTATSTPVSRLGQILSHLNPVACYTTSPLSEALLSSTPSVRSQFSSSSNPSQPVIPMVAFSMPDPRHTKRKFNPNM